MGQLTFGFRPLVGPAARRVSTVDVHVSNKTILTRAAARRSAMAYSYHVERDRVGRERDGWIAKTLGACAVAAAADC